MRLRANWQFLIFLLLVALNLYIVWSTPFFATEDGPEHIAIATTVKNLLLGKCQNISHLYQFTRSPVPTWVANFIIIPLLPILTPWMIEKFLFTLVILSFSFSIYAFVKIFTKENRWIMVPLMLFAFNGMAFMGGYNFMFSYALYFLVLRWWMLKGKVHNYKNFSVLTLLLILEYFFHLFGLAALILSIGGLEIFALYKDRKLKIFCRRVAYYLLSALPVIAMFCWYYALPKMQTVGVIPFGQKIAHLLVPIVIATVSENDKIFTTFCSAFFWLLISLVIVKFWRHKQRGNGQLLVLIIVFALCMFFTPAVFAGGWVIEPRIELYFFIISLIFAATFRFSEFERNQIIFFSICLNIFSFYNKFSTFPEYSRILSTYDKAQNYLPDNVNILQVDLSPYTVNYQSGQQNILYAIPNISGYLTAQKTCLAEVNDRSLGEKNSFPATYKDSTNPNYVLGQLRTVYGLTLMPPRIHLMAYEKKTGTKIDYVVVRGKKENMFHYPPEHDLDEHQLYADFMQQVNAGFTQSYQSTDGLLTIYKAKPKP